MQFDWHRMPFKHYPGVRSLGFSLSQLDTAYAHGSITELEYKWRRMFWTWGAPRLSGRAGRLQDRCYEAFGLEGVDRRIERVARLRSLYVRKHYGEWLLPED